MDTADSISVHGIGFDSEPAARLYGEFARLTVIDAHEHLMPEHERIRRASDAVSLFEAYPRMVLQASGMPAADLHAMSDRSAPVEDRWSRLAPHLPHVRELALTRALMIGTREFYRIERIDDDSYLQATGHLARRTEAGRRSVDACGGGAVVDRSARLIQSRDRTARHSAIAANAPPVSAATATDRPTIKASTKNARNDTAGANT